MYIMAGNAAELCNALVLLGFTANAAHVVTVLQGIDSVELLADLDDKEVESLCDTIHKPGGTIANPAYTIAAVDEIQDPAIPPATLRDPGSKISNCAVKNLKLACFLVRHKIRTYRVYTAANITVATVKAIAPLRGYEESHEDPEDLPKLDKIQKIRECLENIEHHLTQCLGATKVPLAYIIREEVASPALPDPVTGYDSQALDEMISHAPHTSMTYANNNARVWVNSLNKVLHLTSLDSTLQSKMLIPSLMQLQLLQLQIEQLPR
jgi:hypothetical protein